MKNSGKSRSLLSYVANNYPAFLRSIGSLAVRKHVYSYKTRNSGSIGCSCAKNQRGFRDARGKACKSVCFASAGERAAQEIDSWLTNREGSRSSDKMATARHTEPSPLSIPVLSIRAFELQLHGNVCS